MKMYKSELNGVMQISFKTNLDELANLVAYTDRRLKDTMTLEDYYEYLGRYTKGGLEGKVQAALAAIDLESLPQYIADHDLEELAERARIAFCECWPELVAKV